MAESALDIVDRRAAEVATAPRITKEFIEDQIVETLYATGGSFVAAANGPDEHQPVYDHLTICTIRVANGFIVIGKSAPMKPKNFNAQLGQQLAYEDAFRQLWPLYAFAQLEDEWLWEKDEKEAAKHSETPPAPADESA